MRYRFLVVLIILLAACSASSDQEIPTTQSVIIPEQNTEVDPTQAADPSLEPEVDSKPEIELPNLGPAPELTNEIWLNTDQPLPLADLRGKVVLLEMWTFG